jgi:predicted transposase/invertase (TIGR01784 family)
LFEAARIAAMDSQAKIKYIRMIDRERDLRNQFQFATDKGIAEGIEIGREEGRAEGRAEGFAEGVENGVSNVARKLKAMGVDYKTIVESTGLSIEEIEAL